MPICASPRVQLMALVGSRGSLGSTSRVVFLSHPMAATRSSDEDGDDGLVVVVDPVSRAGLGSSSRELHAPSDANTTAAATSLSAVMGNTLPEMPWADRHLRVTATSSAVA